eukprot:scaffold153714_cov16-Tisochrysis_lutea.AAC.1
MQAKRPPPALFVFSLGAAAPESLGQPLLRIHPHSGFLSRQCSCTPVKNEISFTISAFQCLRELTLQPQFAGRCSVDRHCDAAFLEAKGHLADPCNIVVIALGMEPAFRSTGRMGSCKLTTPS